MTIAQKPPLIGILNDAIRSKDYAHVEAKLKKAKKNKIDIDSFVSSTLAPIHHAVQSDDVEIVTLLIEQGADVNLPTKNGVEDTPLHLAIAKGHNRVVRLLLKKSADPNRKDKLGDTALHAAIGKQDLAAVFLLLAYGADPWIKQGKNNKGDNAFKIAKGKIKAAQREAKKIADLTEEPVQRPTSRLRQAFYTLCIVISLLSVLTIGAGLIIFYTHLAAPFIILWTAGGLGLLSVAALLAISSAFRSSPKEELPKIPNPILDMLKNHQAKTRISKAYYASCFIIALGSMSVLGAGIAMYFNAISLPFIPFVAVGGAGEVAVGVVDGAAVEAAEGEFAGAAG